MNRTQTLQMIVAQAILLKLKKEGPLKRLEVCESIDYEKLSYGNLREWALDTTPGKGIGLFAQIGDMRAKLQAYFAFSYLDWGNLIVKVDNQYKSPYILTARGNEVCLKIEANQLTTYELFQLLPQEKPEPRVQRINQENLNRLYDLIGSVIRNCAYYRAGWTDFAGHRVQVIEKEFWTAINGNFLDIATLNWTKIFHKGSTSNPHHASNFINRERLCEEFNKIGINNEVYEEGAKQVLLYRNKHLAHLDDPNQHQKTIFYPNTQFLLKTSYCLYNVLQANEATKRNGFYGQINDYYDSWHAEAKVEYQFRESAENLTRVND